MTKEELEVKTITLFDTIRSSGFSINLIVSFRALLDKYLGGVSLTYKSISYMCALCDLYELNYSDSKVITKIEQLKNYFIDKLGNMVTIKTEIPINLYNVNFNYILDPDLIYLK